METAEHLSGEKCPRCQSVGNWEVGAEMLPRVTVSELHAQSRLLWIGVPVLCKGCGYQSTALLLLRETP